ncbi:MAG: tetratricopeptide repeat protein [Paludibacteraceae bacterium]|nr:tetratricopeptide repeat protein [Paludibacteraceae bacterium]
MTDREKAAAHALASGRLYQALRLMHNPALESGDYSLSDRLQSLEQNYSYLLNYFSSGNNDPQRDDLLRQMTAEGWLLLDDIHKQTIPPSELMLQMRSKAATYIPSDEHFSRLKAIFYRVWSASESPLYDSGDPLALDEDGQCMYVSALTIRIAGHFNEKEILLLIDYTAKAKGSPRLRGLTGLLLLLLHYNDRLPAFPDITARMAELTNKDDNSELLSGLCTRLIETSLTPLANREMESLQQDLRPHLGQDDAQLIINMEEEDGNPAWDESVRNTVGRHIDEMTRLHHEGADFNYTSTRDILTDGFFHHDIANWFVPFDQSNPEIGIDFTDGHGKLIRGILLANTGACDIDRYAMCIIYRRLQGRFSEKAETGLPSVVRDMGEFGDLNLPQTEHTNAFIASGYLRGLYRFFLHNPWKIENLMAHATEVGDTWIFRLCTHAEQRNQFGNRLLALRLYREAEHFFHRQLQGDTIVSDLQKLGYTQQKQGHYQEAVETYKQALQHQTDSWTLEHAAHCLHKIQHLQEAIEMYKRVVDFSPEKKAPQLKLAQCLTETGQTEEALQLLYKLDLLYPDESDIQRGLGWCAFLTGRKESAERYLERLAYTTNASPNDEMNYGHLLLTNGHREEALQMYESSMKKDGKPSVSIKRFRQDAEILQQKGISREELALIEDTMMWRYAAQRPLRREEPDPDNLPF